jgi:hypothetical protein
VKKQLNVAVADQKESKTNLNSTTRNHRANRLTNSNLSQNVNHKRDLLLVDVVVNVYNVNSRNNLSKEN